jgi:hypothetical protein
MVFFLRSFLWLLALGSPVTCLGAATIIEVTLPTNDIVYDPISDQILAAVPSRAGAVRGNTITPINPYSGAVGTSVFVTSEPSKLALADDGSRVYVASESTNSVTPFSLLTMSPGTPFPIGHVSHRVEDMDVVPGNPAALAVSLRGGGLSVFLDDNKLPKDTQAVANVIEFGTTPGLLYSHVNQNTTRAFQSFVIDLSPLGGVGERSYYVERLVNDISQDMEFDNGRMYFTNGQIAEVSTPAPVGSFMANGPLEPNFAIGRTHFAVGNKIKAFSQSTFVPLGELSIPQFAGSAKNLISLGNSAMALTTTNDQLFILRLSGDYDANGFVNHGDYDVWKASYGSTTNIVADANRDNIVDAADYVLWRRNFGEWLVGSVPTSSSAVGPVPEPETGTLSMLSLLSLAFRFRHCRFADSGPVDKKSAAVSCAPR